MLSIEKVAYLKGLATGLELGSDTKQDKLISAIIDVLDVVAHDIEILDDVTDDITAEIDAVSDDLSVVEKIFNDDCDISCSEDDENYDCSCGQDHEHAHGEDNCCCSNHDENLYEVICPGCNKALTIDDRILDIGSTQCPNCGATLEFNMEEDPEEAPSQDQQ